MKRFLRNNWRLLILALFLLALIAVAVRVTNAEVEPEVVVFEILPTPTPTPFPTSEPIATPEPVRNAAYREFDWPQSTIDALASVYWAECNTPQEKLAVTVLICNRWLYGPPFGASIEAVIAQRGEFQTGHVSDANRDLARVHLNRWLTQYYGDYAGIDVPRSAVYMARVGGNLELYNDSWHRVWPKP